MQATAAFVQGDRAPVLVTSAATWRKATIATTIGNGLEWFNFTVYSFFAVIIARLFFPTGNDSASFMLAVVVSDAGFFMCPVGAVAPGIYADHAGRKVTLTLTIMLMAIGMAIIGPVPTYTQIDIGAPISIMITRLIQGFSAGDEVGGATAFLIEYSLGERRGYFASWQQASQSISFILGAAMGATVTNGLSPERINAWGQCIPFLLNLLIGLAGTYIRSYLHEPPAFEAQKVKAVKEPRLTSLS